MVRCPECRAEVQPDWDWCHACGWDPEAKLPATTPTAHPEVLRPELVPRGDATPAPGDRAPAGAARRPGPTGGAGYVPNPSRAVPVAVIAGGVAVAIVVLGLVFLGRGEPSPVVTADRTPASFTTTTALALTPWALPEGAFKVDLPVALEPAAAPAVPAPFVAGVAYSGAADGREYLVASLAVHPAYKWEDLGRALIDSVDDLGEQHGFTVTDRSAGAFKEMSSSRFSFVASRGPTETEAEFTARTAGAATGEGIALVKGNHLYVVLVKGTSLLQAQFTPVLESVTVV